MSRKRPTEVSWDSDDDLLQDDISGINAFPHSKKEDALDEEIDEDALLGSDDETGGKGYTTGENDTSYANKGDLSKVSDVANSTFGASETDNYLFADDGGEAEVLEDVIEIEPEVDSSLLIDSQDDAEPTEESDYQDNEGEGVTAGFNSTAETTQDLNTTEGGVADDEAGDDSSSESDGEGGRIRFKTERSSIVSLSQSKSRTDIPDTLEISEEQQATIDEFLTKDGRRKNQRGGFRGGARGGRGRTFPQQQRSPGSSPGDFNRNTRPQPPHMMQGGYRPNFHPTQQSQPNSNKGPILSSPSTQHSPNTGQARPRTILINPHFRGPAAASSAPDTSVTWSNQTPAPRQPQMTNPPSFPPPANEQPPYPVQPQPLFNRPPQHSTQAFSDPHQSHNHHDPHRNLDFHRGRDLNREPDHLRVQDFRREPDPLMSVDSRPGFNPNIPPREPFSQGPPYPTEEPRGFHPGYPSQPSYPTDQQSSRYGQSHAPALHSLSPMQRQPLLASSPTPGLGGALLGMPQPHSAPGLLSLPPRPGFAPPPHHAGLRNDPYFHSHPNPPFSQGHADVPTNLHVQSGPLGGHPGRSPQRTAFSGGNAYHSQQNQRQQLTQQQRDPAIAFGFLDPPKGFPTQQNQLHPQRSPQRMGGQRSFPHAQQSPRQHPASQFQQASIQNRGRRFPRGQGQQNQPVQRSRPGVLLQTPTNNNNNNITLVNPAPQKRLSSEIPFGSSPPKVPRNEGHRNVRDRLQLPRQQQQTNPQLQQQHQQQQSNQNSTKAVQPAEPEEPEDEATKDLKQKIEEQKRLRAEIIKRKEARRLQQAQQRRVELQKKLAEQGMTLSDVESGSGSSAKQQTPAPQQTVPQQNTLQQKNFTSKKVSLGQQRQGQMIPTKRQGPNTGQMEMSYQEPPNKMSRQMSQPQQNVQQMGSHANPGAQTGNQIGFNRQNSRGRGGAAARGQRVPQRGGMTRQFSGGGNSSQLQGNTAQNQGRQVKLQPNPQTFVNQNNNRSVVVPGQQDYSGQNQFSAGRGLNSVKRGLGQAGRSQGQAGRGQVQLGRGQGQVGRGQMQFGRGQGQVGRGQVQVSRGQGQASRGQGQVGRGQGQVGRGQGQFGRGQGQFGRGQGQVGRGQGQAVRGQGQAGRGQAVQGQSPFRGRGQVVIRGRGQVQRGRGQAVVRQVSAGSKTTVQGERTVVTRNVSGNNIVLGSPEANGPNQNASRRVVVGTNVHQASHYVSVDNLSTSTTQQKLAKLCKSVGPVESVQLLQSQNKAIIKFKNPNHSMTFAKKYDRYLLDLSSIRVSSLPT